MGGGGVGLESGLVGEGELDDDVVVEVTLGSEKDVGLALGTVDVVAGVGHGEGGAGNRLDERDVGVLVVLLEGLRGGAGLAGGEEEDGERHLE